MKKELYWPRAIALTEDGSPIQLFTNDPVFSIESCNMIFVIWQDLHHYTLLATWVDTELHKGLHYKCYVDTVGQVRKI